MKRLGSIDVLPLYSVERISCGYSLELPHRGDSNEYIYDSNEYHNIRFYGEVEEIIIKYHPLIWSAAVF